MLAHLIAQVCLAAVAVYLGVAVLKRRALIGALLAPAVGLAALLLLTSIIGVWLDLASDGGSPAPLGFTWLTLLQIACIAAMAGGTVLHASRGHAPSPKPHTPADTCTRGMGLCPGCRDTTVAQVCVSVSEEVIVSATSAFLEMAGHDPGASLCGRPSDTVIDLSAVGFGPETPPDHRARTIRTSLSLADGTSLPVLATCSGRASDAGPILAVTVLDASSLFEAECRARDAEALHTALLEQSPAATLTVTLNGRITRANAAASRLLGLPGQSLVGRGMPAVLDQITARPLDADAWLARSWRDGTRTVSVMLARHDGSEVPVELTTRSVWELPEPMLFVFGRDLSHERRLERKLAATHRLSVLGKLTDGMAHDVNNILAAILARGQMLQDKVDRPEARESLRLIERAAIDGGHIVRRGLDLARGRKRAGAEPVDLNVIVTDAVEMCRSRTRQASASIRIETRLADTAAVRGDGSELRELLINLILNAIEAMPHGGTLTVTTGSGVDSVRLAVTDTGCGMDAAVGDRMFEPFFTTKGSRGTGLGLSLVRQIATRHGATLEVDTEPGRGTTVRAVFPTATAPADEPTAGPSSDAAAREEHLGRVLIVDDDLSVLAVARDILVRAGHHVRTAETARQALITCRRGDVDAAILDLAMPDADGWQLADEMRAVDPAIGLVMLSGWAGAADEARPRGAFDLCLGKPFTVPRLRETTSDAIGLAAARRAEQAKLALAGQPSAGPAPAGIDSPA